MKPTIFINGKQSTQQQLNNYLKTSPICSITHEGNQIYYNTIEYAEILVKTRQDKANLEDIISYLYKILPDDEEINNTQIKIAVNNKTVETNLNCILWNKLTDLLEEMNEKIF